MILWKNIFKRHLHDFLDYSFYFFLVSLRYKQEDNFGKSIKWPTKQKCELRLKKYANSYFSDFIIYSANIYTCQALYPKTRSHFTFVQRWIEYHAVFWGPAGTTGNSVLSLDDSLDVCYHSVWSTGECRKKRVLFTPHLYEERGPWSSHPGPPVPGWARSVVEGDRCVAAL